MKGQVFILGVISLIMALFFVLPSLQKEVYVPQTKVHMLENIAEGYNYWISYSSLEEDYKILDFGNFVKNNYPELEFFYILDDEEDTLVANFFDLPINFTLNGKSYNLESNGYIKIDSESEIIFSSQMKNFTYEPRNSFSGAIFIELDNDISNEKLLRIFP